MLTNDEIAACVQRLSDDAHNETGTVALYARELLKILGVPHPDRDVLPLIPTDRFGGSTTPWFTRYEGEWHVIGPADVLVTGKTVEIERAWPETPRNVVVGRHVAERTVTRRATGERVRYVVAEFENP